jgi:high-affinity nickel-transport protein
MILGITAISIGARLPSWVDGVMEPLVGITLILLGSYVLYSVARFRSEYKLKSRWMILFSLVQNLSNKLHSKLHHEDRAHDVLHHPEKYDSKAAFGIGMIHGIGAETPTQILLFLAASDVRSSIAGVVILFSFVSGLMISNSAITVLSILGFTTVKNNKSLYVILGLLTGTMSLVLGLTYLFGRGSLLPAIFAG